MQLHRLVACSIVIALGLVAFGNGHESFAQSSAGNSTVSLADNLAIKGILRGMQPFVFQDPDHIRRVVFTRIAPGGSIAEKPARMFSMSKPCSATEVNFGIPIEDYQTYPHIIHVFDCTGEPLADRIWFMPAGGTPRLVWSRT